MKSIRLFFISVFLSAAASAVAGPPTYEAAQPLPTPADENHRELFDYELDYTGNSSFFDDHGKFGNGDSLYNDFSYAHRFLITGQWYFRYSGDLCYESFRTNDVITPERKLQVHNAVVQYRENKAGVQVTYPGLKPFDIALGGGVTVSRNFDFFRDEASAKTTPAPFV